MEKKKNSWEDRPICSTEIDDYTERAVKIDPASVTAKDVLALQDAYAEIAELKDKIFDLENGLIQEKERREQAEEQSEAPLETQLEDRDFYRRLMHGLCDALIDGRFE